jgi:RNA polymerase sigma-70 factor (ECF subfamily)
LQGVSSSSDVFDGVRPAPPAASREVRLRGAITAHYEVLWRTLRRLGVEERSVEDAAQQVLIVLARRLDEVRPGAERAFMLASATRVAADARKKVRRAREELGVDELAARPSPAPGVDELLDRGRARDLLDVVLGELPDDLRAVFVLFELEELTMATIAETLGLPQGTVASRLRRARELFEAAAARLARRRERS